MAGLRDWKPSSKRFTSDESSQGALAPENGKCCGVGKSGNQSPDFGSPGFSGADVRFGSEKNFSEPFLFGLESGNGGPGFHGLAVDPIFFSISSENS